MFSLSLASRPWAKVYVLTGDALASITAEMSQKYDEDKIGEDDAEYQFYPEELPQMYLMRRHDFGRSYYGAMGVQRGDSDGRKKVVRRN